MIRSLGAPLEAEVKTEDTFVALRNLTREKLEECLNRGDKLWIDLIDPDNDEIQWLEQMLDLHPTVVADLKRADRRPSLLVYPEYLFLSLFQPVIQLDKVVGDEIHCLIGEKFFVTLRKSSSNLVDDAYQRVAQNKDLWRRGVAYFLYLTVQHVVDGYYPLLDRISLKLNKLEENIAIEGSPPANAQRTVYRVKSQLIHLRQMVAPQREVLANALGEKRLAGSSEDRDLFRHLYERLLRIYDIIDSQRDLTSNVLDMIQSRESSRLADAVNRLTIFSMIFLPLTFFVGMFELNFATTSDQLTLPISGGVMFIMVIVAMVVSASLMVWFFRYKKWL